MKRALFFLALATAFSCTEKKEYITVAPNNPEYIINGLSDMILELKDTVYVPLEVKWVTGPQEKVTLAFDDLPPGLTAVFTPANGFPSFNTTLMLTSGTTTAGNYDLVLNMSTDKKLVKSFKIQMTIKPKASCTDEVVGVYSTDYACQTTGIKSEGVNIIATDVNTINFSSLWIGDTTAGVNATLNCSNGAVTIPTQNFISGYTLSGTGKFYKDSIRVNYTLRHTATSSDVESCSALLKR